MPALNFKSVMSFLVKEATMKSLFSYVKQFRPVFPNLMENLTHFH